MKRFYKALVIFLVSLMLMVVGCNIWVVGSTKNQTYSSINKVPFSKVALVLGTSHRNARGGVNTFFNNRIEAAYDLYVNGKAEHFILSGDNRTKYYNEPLEMKNALVKKGVPETEITLDYAGFRTFDSIVRSKKIFGQDELIIITQPFHSYRALFISNYYDIKAVAMLASEPDFKSMTGIRIREYFARLKAVLDLYILGTEPYFLGEKEQIQLSE